MEHPLRTKRNRPRTSEARGRAPARPNGLALCHLALASEQGGLCHHKTHLPTVAAPPHGQAPVAPDNRDSQPSNSEHPLSNKAEGRESERLPVPTGWRFATLRWPRSREVSVTINRAAQPSQRHPTVRLPSPQTTEIHNLRTQHTRSRTRPKAARASACPSPGLALCHLSLTSERGRICHHKAHPLDRRSAIPRAGSRLTLCSTGGIRAERDRPRTRPQAAWASACPPQRAGALPPRAGLGAGRGLAGIKHPAQPV